MTFISIYLIVFVISASTLGIFAIIYLKSIFKNINAIQQDINLIVGNTIPILRNMDQITRKVTGVVTEAKVYWYKIDNSIRILSEMLLIFGSLKKFSNIKKKVLVFKNILYLFNKNRI
jgi:uncharacterized protein YoxC